MSGKIRLGCQHCDRNDFDGGDKLPKDWDDISRVRSIKEALREVDPDDKRLRLRVVDGPRIGNSFEWKRDLLLPFWADGRQRRLF